MSRRILIGTPVYRELDPHFLGGLIPVLRKSYPDVTVGIEVVAGLPVNFARNIFASYALSADVDELLFIDADMGWEEKDFERIIQHKDADIVGMIYARKEPGRPHFHVNAKPHAEIDEKTGLGEVLAIATGFMKIKVKTVFPAIEKKFPHLKHNNGFEYFPMGVVDGVLLGEDYYFCRMARECGFKIYADWHAGIIPHFGSVSYPITQDMVDPIV